MQHTTQTLTAPDGATLFAQAWEPDTAPRGVVVLVHGVAEHSGRYQHVAAFLVERGYAVCAYDHRGHGRSDGERAQIRHFNEYVDDLRLVFERVHAAHANTPLFLYGHSMGSIVALLFALRYQDELAGLVLTGTALRLPIRVPSPLLRPAGWIAKIIPGAAIIPAIVLSGLSRDSRVIEAYRTDPLVTTGRLKLGWSFALASAVAEVERRLPEIKLPLLALHGGDDPITLPGGADVVRERAGSNDLTVRVYPGLRHEIHQEPEQAQVLGDIAAWLDAHSGE